MISLDASIRMMLCIFFFKQKTAYEMRISDWSSDVCSSDLMNTFAFVSTTFWPPGAALPSLQGLMTLVSHAFLHFDLMHLGLNLGFLLAFGSFVERHLGLLRYLALFALTAAAGALAEYAFAAEPLALIRSGEPTSELQSLMRHPY